MSEHTNTQRDELARVATKAADNDGLYLGHLTAENIGDAILAAGYSKPRTIETVEELDALPDGAIIREGTGNATQAVKRQDGKNWWIDGPNGTSASPLIPLPATVLHEPGAGE